MGSHCSKPGHILEGYSYDDQSCDDLDEHMEPVLERLHLHVLQELVEVERGLDHYILVWSNLHL